MFDIEINAIGVVMLQGYFGDPYTSCRAECLSHGDCPSSRPSCINSKCMDPCAGVCGVNANCRVKDGTTAICSCPRHMTGNPFVSCRPFEKSKSSFVLNIMKNLF